MSSEKKTARFMTRVISKIMKTYARMKGDYINENGIEIVKDSFGNIVGTFDGLAFISLDNTNLVFYSDAIQYETRNVSDEDKLSTRPKFGHLKFTASLARSRKYTIDPYYVQLKYWYGGKSYTELSEEEVKERVEEVRSNLMYSRIDKALSFVRPKTIKK